MTTKAVTSTTLDDIFEQGEKIKPSVSVVVPAYNEACIIEKNLAILCEYLEYLDDKYLWELIVVNDGSTDETGDLVEAFARGRENIHVFHHLVNFGLGQALRTAFNHCSGDYVVTLDLDLSYSPDHIEGLLHTIRETKADVVIASPYMKGGKTSNVPLKRLILSKCANRFLSFLAPGKLSTLTGMVRVYEGKLLKKINLKAMDFDINTEIIYKAWLLSSKIIEIPAHLDWSEQRDVKKERKSTIRILRTTFSFISRGFMFKPFMFFILPGLGFAAISLYSITWFMIQTLLYYQDLAASSGPSHNQFYVAAVEAYNHAPHAFFIGAFCVMLAIQMISLGLLALQSKKYFDDMFHIGSTIYKFSRENHSSSSVRKVANYEDSSH